MTSNAEVSKAWRDRGFSCSLWTDPPGQEWPDFTHDVDELVMLMEGEIEIEFGGQTVRPEIGEEVLIPAGTSHTVRNTGHTINQWLYGYKKH